jgi:Tfp pilus assembly protein PilW
LSLAELLISLLISATLLTAVAAAIDASFKSYQVNEEQSTLTQRARLALYRMLTEIRTTQTHQPYTSSCVTSFSTGQVVTDTGLSMFDNNGTQVTYYYDAASQQLRVIHGTTTNVVLQGVTAFQVKMEPMKSAESVKTGSQTYDLLMRATVLLTVATNSKTSSATETTGTQTVTISSSVMPRRNVW